MREGLFWEKDADKISAVIDAFDQLSDSSYIWVTNLKKHETWCTEKTQELFSLPDQIIPDFEQKLTEYLYPEDRPEYLQKIKKRMLGTDLDQELCIRMRTQNGSYSLFSIHTQILSDENDTPEYLIALIKNENIFHKIDALTDLYSEARYIDDLKKAIAQENRFAILQIQVKGFSTFNLVYGRDFSNKLLREIAIRFIYMMDADKAVYRLESECFVFILKKAGREELLDFDRKVRLALDTGIMVEGQLHPLKIASGAILLENYCGDVSSLCGQVSYALNHSINKHQHQIVIFNDEVKTANGADLALMKVIHQSVRNNCEGFYLVYQPIVDSNTGEIVGAEALVRWSREPYGTVPPGMFIEWLETDPSMYDLGNFVLRTALSETKPLLASKPDFFINVNLSVRQLERPEFHREVVKILDETKFPAGNLCMELTERCKDFPLDVLKEEVCYFQSLGIRVAMDDYGTGSASSNIVMNVPMNEIKIDMSFIRGIIDNPKNQAMVRSILYFADKSNMATCLEGVENEELQNYLRDYNATWFQGYYYSKPIPLNELEKLMK
ncbi:MAG: EAL domain-containing protein [Lachnospiraceae bacterium]